MKLIPLCIIFVFTTLSFAQNSQLENWENLAFKNQIKTNPDNSTKKQETPSAKQSTLVIPIKDLQQKAKNEFFKTEEGLCFDASLGYKLTYADSEKIPGALSRIAIEHSDDINHYVRADFAALKDQRQDKDDIDFDRHSLWSEARLNSAWYPTQLKSAPGDVLRVGIRGCIEGIENSPTSVEHSLNFNLSPGFVISDKRNTLTFDVGIYNNHFELDDDIPLTQGFNRDELKLESIGLSCSTSITHRMENGTTISARARNLANVSGEYSESSVGASLEVPLSLVFGENCQFWIRATYEHRYFDLGENKQALPFDDDSFTGVEFVYRMGRRSRLSYGY